LIYGREYLDAENHKQLSDAQTAPEVVMASKELWHYFFESVEDDKKTNIIKLLSVAGVNSSQYNSDLFYNNDGCLPGIVFFNRPNSKLYNFLKEISQQGLCRVLAVALDRELSSTDIWSLLECGAEDAFALSHFSNFGAEIAARLAHWEQVDEIVESPLVTQNLVGKSPVWIKTLRQVVHIARFTDASILITGESGTGKELLARLIHALDKKRGKNSLVVLDCTTIVPELSGSEFFGHERGAFTGAIAGREGAFALAHKGTLFLDEVGELPLALQAELLRVVQEQKYKRVGGNSWQNTDFRLICATNRNLLEQEREGNFRRDFYHRLATWTCHLPPLANRVEDVPRLARHFLTKIFDGREPPEFDDAVSEYLVRREYPGNVRELYQLVKRIAYQHIGNGLITSGDIPAGDRPKSNLELTEWRDDSFEQNIYRAILLGVKLKDITRATEETAETVAILQANGKVANAAERLGIDKRTLQMHVKEYKDRLVNGFG
jgi:transcriptional regulator with GAF, ATPase, and Fis domain